MASVDNSSAWDRFDTQPAAPLFPSFERFAVVTREARGSHGGVKQWQLVGLITPGRRFDSLHRNRFLSASRALRVHDWRMERCLKAQVKGRRRRAFGP